MNIALNNWMTNFADDNTFFDKYPLESEIKDFLKVMWTMRENYEKMGFTGLEEKFGYATIKRNIAWLNNQLKEGYIYYKGDKVVVLVDLNNPDKIVSDTCEGNPGDKYWYLQNGEKLRYRPNAWAYYEFGVRPMVLNPILVEQYFLPEWENGKAGQPLKYVKRIVEYELTEPVNQSNIFAKENVE